MLDLVLAASLSDWEGKAEAVLKKALRPELAPPKSSLLFVEKLEEVCGIVKPRAVRTRGRMRRLSLVANLLLNAPPPVTDSAAHLFTHVFMTSKISCYLSY